MDGRIDAEYVLPIRRTESAVDPDLRTYLRRLSDWIDVTVVDGSAAGPYAALGAALSGTGIRQLAPAVTGRNGKARGAMTGILTARHERIVIADDDIRYTRATLERVCRELRTAAFVRVQNHYAPLTWWARWDTGRILINRAFGGDYGGTVGVRRSVALRTGGYRTDVLFENLELERTVAAAGGRVRVPRDLLVIRRPPTLRHFLGQRVRQAYDDLAQPVRLVAEAALLPLVLALALSRRRRLLLGAVTAAILAVAAHGRRVDAGAAHFPADGPLWALGWVGERMITVWLALFVRLRGGVRYSGTRLRDAASSPAALRARLRRIPPLEPQDPRSER